MVRPDSVQVCIDLDGGADPLVMGTLRCHRSGSGELLSFAYDEGWLRRPQALSLDPDLALVSGLQYPEAAQATFGIFRDASPDRWGRLLMQRRESLSAHDNQRRPRLLTEWDFLLGVYDETRLGALRFRQAPGLPFIDDDRRRGVPPISSLRELQAASLNLEQHEYRPDHPDYAKWLAQLIAPGTSLGGARPKATVRDETGALCMAKFPSRNDLRDVGAWELVAHRLAALAGITVPAARGMQMPGSAHTTFVVNRFDRNLQGHRLPFVSAMTLVQRTDGEAGASYLELVDQLRARGADPRADCEELFRRVLFSILIHNTDDHLRNHGFLVDEHGVHLSPAYDLNPTVDQHDLSLAINEVETACDVDIAMAACRDYGLRSAAADRLLNQVRAAVAQWRDVANSVGISRAEQALMASAFEQAAPKPARRRTKGGGGGGGGSDDAPPGAVQPPRYPRGPRPPQGGATVMISTMETSQQLDLLGAPPPATDRLFFALMPPPAVAPAITELARQRQQVDGLKGRPLAPDRLHITLHHVGDFAGLQQGLLNRAMAAAASLAMLPFDLQFDRVRSFAGRPGSRPFVLSGSDEGVAGVMAFQRTLCDALRRQGFAISPKQTFTPHLTLLYDDKLVPEQQVDPIGWTASDFVLIHSLLGKTVHIPLGRWPVRAEG